MPSLASHTFCSALACAVPDFDGSRHITACHIEAGGRETGNGGLGGVLGVLLADCGVIDGAEEDGFA